MKLKNIINTIREEIALLKGEKTVDKKYCSQHTFPDEPTALDVFARSREKLFNVNRWSDLSSLTANFILHDQAGNSKLSGWPAVDDYIKVVLPGPTPENWVRVTQIVDEEQMAGFTVRPCSDPHEETEETAHFFTDESTSTFVVELTENTLTACQIGKNESVNNQDQEAGNRAVVNTLIAETGWLFYQKVQWKLFTDYLVEL